MVTLMIFEYCDNRSEINELQRDDKGCDSISPLVCEANRLFSRRVPYLDRIDRPRREKTKEISYGDEQLLRDRRK